MADSTTDYTSLYPGTGGDNITTEAHPAGEARSHSDAPTTAYKMPRSKIAVGAFGVDEGDATPDHPLPVGDYAARRLLGRIEQTLTQLEARSLGRGSTRGSSRGRR